MLQAILERIVLKYFGEYLMDFNQKNISLAIWNGSLKIQGLKFKPCILSELNLPIKLQYSWIGTLEILVPWSKLSAHPVEIRIMDIFIIVSPVKRNFWQTKFDNAYIKMEFIQDLMKKLLIKQKEKNPNISSKSGYFDLIIAKIIDNIQLKIENIHIRFENDIMDYPFTLGITLKQLTIETKDKTWSKMNFYDRTNPKNKNIPINKHLILRNFEVYLNSNDKLFFGKSETSSIINEKMNLFEKNMDYDISTSEKKTHLLRINDYLLNVSFDLKLTINFDHNYYSLPEYLGEMNVENMNLNLKNTQIQDVINLLEFFNEYEFFMSSYKKKIHYSLSEKPILINLKSLSAKNKSKLLQNLWIYWGELVIFELRKINFIRLMTQYLASNPKSTNFKLTKLQKSNSKILRDICQRTSIEYLKKWYIE